MRRKLRRFIGELERARPVLQRRRAETVRGTLAPAPGGNGFRQGVVRRELLRSFGVVERGAVLSGTPVNAAASALQLSRTASS